MYKALKVEGGWGWEKYNGDGYVVEKSDVVFATQDEAMNAMNLHNAGGQVVSEESVPETVAEVVETQSELQVEEKKSDENVESEVVETV